MAAITEQNAIRYCIDNLDTSSYGVIITRAGSELDFTRVSAVNGMTIRYEQPSGTQIKILFRNSDGADWYRLNYTGNAVKIMTGTPEYEDIKMNGNTISELLALENIPAFTGKKILMAISLWTQDKNNAVPKIKLEIQVQNDTQTLTHTEYSPLYELGSDGIIANITADKKLNGDATAEIYAQITRSDGSISDWMPLTSVHGQKGTHIKLRCDYAVKRLNAGSAALNSAIVTHSGNTVLTGTGTGEIISYTQNWYMNVRHCRMNIRHKELTDSEINAYVCFRKQPEIISSEQLGIGTGKRTTYQILHKNGLKYDSVKLYYDNQRVYDIFDVNTEAGRITCTAPEGTIITVSYEYGWGVEIWQKMDLHSLISYEDYDVSEYRYTRADDGENMSVCAVKITLTTKTGNMQKESVGTGTGKSQTYKLSHIVSDGKISIYSGDTAMSAKSYALTEDMQYVRIAGSPGAKLSASYNWISEMPVVYQFAAVFAA